MVNMTSAENKEDISPSNDSVMNKYVNSGTIANDVMKKLVSLCVEGASARQICIAGDEMILTETGKIFKKDKAMKKGIAFPTCVSVNDCICHFSPLNSDTDEILKIGDVVKIDLGVYLDGFIGGLATTVVVGADENSPVTGEKADLLYAAHIAEEVILRTLNSENTNKTATEMFGKVMEDMEMKGIEDMICFQIEKNCLEGEKKIVLVPVENNEKEYKTSNFEDYDVYCIDLFITNSTSNKAKIKDARTTVFKKSDIVYNLRMKTSKDLLKQVTTKAGSMAFNLRMTENESKARMAIKECVEHGVLTPYHVLYLKEGGLCVHTKFTAIITPNGVLKTTSFAWNDKLVKSDKVVKNEELLKLLEKPYGNKKSKKQK